MQIPENKVDEKSLTALGMDALRLLHSGDLSALADRFGYVRSFHRKPLDAIRDEIDSCLASLSATRIAKSASSSTVHIKYFKPNDAALFALVECVAATDNSGYLLMELIVTTQDLHKHITIEDFTAQNAPL